MPVWHASLSLQGRHGVKLRVPDLLEAKAIELLADVGGDTEWWIWRSLPAVAHLRVAVTTEENALIPPGFATSDAGPSGPLRRRKR